MKTKWHVSLHEVTMKSHLLHDYNHASHLMILSHKQSASFKYYLCHSHILSVSKNQNPTVITHFLFLKATAVKMTCNTPKH